MKHGLATFADHEILEILLFYAIPRGDTNELAHRILNECGGRLCDVFNSSYAKLTSIKGVSRHTAVLLKMIPDLSAYYANSKFLTGKGIPISDVEKVCGYFEAMFMGSPKEAVYFAGVTDELLMEPAKLIHRGGVSSTLLRAGGFLDFISDFGYSRIVMAHNHPHGKCLPSAKDVKATRYIVESLGRMGITLVDHIIVGQDGSMSMRSSRLVSQIWKQEDTSAASGDNEPDIWE